LRQNFVPLGERIPLKRQRMVPARSYFTVIDSSSVKTVADKHRLAAYNMHHWRAFRCYRHR